MGSAISYVGKSDTVDCIHTTTCTTSVSTQTDTNPDTPLFFCMPSKQLHHLCLVHVNHPNCTFRLINAPFARLTVSK
jgi:hypothetical protein